MALQQNNAFSDAVLSHPLETPLKIAIVEDEIELTDLLEIVLNGSGKFHVVARARTGWDALALLQDHEIDVVLVDLSLPGLNGMMVLEHLQREAPGLPVVIMSGFPTVDVFSRGAKGFIEKQGDLTDLPSKLLELLVSA